MTECVGIEGWPAISTPLRRPVMYGRFAGHDHGQDTLAPFAVWYAHKGEVADAGIGPQQWFHLGRVDLLASADDDVLQSSGNEEVALIVEISEVAGAQVAVADRRGGLVGTPPVRRHHVFGARYHLAGLTGREAVSRASGPVGIGFS